MTATKPFPQVLRALMDEREMSIRNLERITRRHGEGVSGPAIGHMLKGNLPPTLRTIEALSVALQVPPETFAEYEMAVLRRDLNPTKVGFRKALTTLRSIQDAS